MDILGPRLGPSCPAHGHATLLVTLPTALCRAVPLTMMVLDGNVLSQPHITDGSGIKRVLTAMPLEVSKIRKPDDAVLEQCRYAVDDTLEEGGSVLVFCSTQWVSSCDPCGNWLSLHWQRMTSLEQDIEVAQPCSAYWLAACTICFVWLSQPNAGWSTDWLARGWQVFC